MKKNRLIFFAIFGVLHLFIFFFSLYMDRNDQNLSFLFELQKRIWMLKYGSFLLLGLMITDFIWYWRELKNQSNEQVRLKNELTQLKAKLFDLQEESKSKPNTPNTTGTTNT